MKINKKKWMIIIKRRGNKRARNQTDGAQSGRCGTGGYGGGGKRRKGHGKGGDKLKREQRKRKDGGVGGMEGKKVEGSQEEQLV